MFFRGQTGYCGALALEVQSEFGVGVSVDELFSQHMPVEVRKVHDKQPSDTGSRIKRNKPQRLPWECPWGTCHHVEVNQESRAVVNSEQCTRKANWDMMRRCSFADGMAGVSHLLGHVTTWITHTLRH